MASDFVQTISEIPLDVCDTMITEQALFDWGDFHWGDYGILTFRNQEGENYMFAEWDYDLQLAATDATMNLDNTSFGLHNVSSTDDEISPL
ncbi:uncharacterized protein MAM_01266 [Metarhizium album ARSEF 1941]|uniref:Uncharacterized protein n=1 Tax=Metarhizium album (strain ARSEF 1941) TaxID=1081103 RepID=A0A0B2X405_METAS|nr:uncharacterized protein MAM_01266 [Metarhizium album ARSEF 1941]KHO00488.1 hypothetical protein MAM_01266 [Metarhizium album ARSEF 1941]